VVDTLDRQFATTETKLSSHRAALTCAGPMVAPVSAAAFAAGTNSW
jgi:hypothetical protein